MTRLEVILETVAELLEGSKRKWSREQRSAHAQATETIANASDKRHKQKSDQHMKELEDLIQTTWALGDARQPYNYRKVDAKIKLGVMKGINPGSAVGVGLALDAMRARYRNTKIKK